MVNLGMTESQVRRLSALRPQTAKEAGAGFESHLLRLGDPPTGTAPTCSTRPTPWDGEEAAASLVDRRYPLDQIVEAYRYVETGRKIGNVVVSVRPPA
jgi:hypothetical protein